MIVEGKPYEAAGKDDTRPVLTGVNLKTDADGRHFLEATDSYALVRIEVTDAEGDTDGLIPAAAVKTARMNKYNHELSANSVVEVTDGKTDAVLRFDRPEGQFPNAGALIPDDEDIGFRIGVNVQYLLKLAKALESDELELQFQNVPNGEPNPLKPIRVKPIRSKTNVRGVGVVMPIRLSV